MLNKSGKPSKPLSGLEHSVMDSLWAAGSATAEQVREALAPRRRLKDSTVRTVLRRLEQKGYVTHRTDSRTYIYDAVAAPQSVATHAVRQIIDRFCGGSVELLLTGMIENEVLDPRELEKLARKIARKREIKGG